MQQTEQVAILSELRQFARDRKTDVAGADTEHLVSADRYTDVERYRTEIDRVFVSRPAIVGHVAEFAEDGAYKTVRLGHVEVLVVRSGAEIKAFQNVCQHRGTVLVESREGEARSFACPYHAWTYGRSGELRHLPDDYGFPKVAENKEAFGLPELWCDSFHGFVYVQADGGVPELPLRETMDEIGADLTYLGLDDYVKQDRRVTEYPVNWKLPFDIFLENYHTRYAHRDTIFKVFLPNVAKYARLGESIRCVLPRRSIVDLDESDTSTWDIVEQSTLLYHIWPNGMLAVLPEHAAFWTILPRDTGTTEIDFTALLSRRAAESTEEQEHWLKSLKVVYKVKREDTERFLSIQKGIDSGGIRELVFGRFEKAIGWFHDTLDRALSR